MATNHTKAIRELILWARKERIVLSSVTHGSTTVEIQRDYGLQPPRGSAEPLERKGNILEQYAGVLAPHLRGEVVPDVQTMEPTEEDE